MRTRVKFGLPITHSSANFSSPLDRPDEQYLLVGEFLEQVQDLIDQHFGEYESGE